MKLRFEIGLCEFKYSGLGVGFLSIGFTIACLSVNGKTPSLNDALHIGLRVMGSASSVSRFNNHVGAGSSAVFHWRTADDLCKLIYGDFS